jgi:hypothetical protein
MRLNYYFSSPHSDFEAEKISFDPSHPIKNYFYFDVSFRQRLLQKFGRQNLLGTFIGRKKNCEKVINLDLSCVYIGEGYAIMPATATVKSYLPWSPWAVQQK